MREDCSYELPPLDNDSVLTSASIAAEILEGIKCPVECFFASRCSSQCSVGSGILLDIIIGKSGESA